MGGLSSVELEKRKRRLQSDVRLIGVARGCQGAPVECRADHGEDSAEKTIIGTKAAKRGGAGHFYIPLNLQCLKLADPVDIGFDGHHIMYTRCQRNHLFCIAA
jgi:hypothetical protein